jgi:hypothetical protein
MIVYSVVCPEGHEFDGWFRDSSSFDAQVEAGDVACPYCGSAKVAKALSAPNLAMSGALSQGRQKAAAGELAKARNQMAKAVRKVREHVETHFDYVGPRFAEEARRIHYGETRERGIYGEATGAEVKELHDEGVRVAPLPELPEKAN